jgi:hypothetical protein
MEEHQVDALPVVEEGEVQPDGVITRARIGRFLFDHYARRSGRA